MYREGGFPEHDTIIDAVRARLVAEDKGLEVEG
jgi:hypothetical protein